MIRRLLSGFGLSGTILLVTMTAQIIMVPLLLKYWGTVVYGEWLVLTNLASSLSILNLGVQSYVCNLLIASYVKGDIEKGSRLLQSALFLYILFAGLALLVVLVLGLSPNLLSWMKINQISESHGRMILIIFGTMATYSIFGGLLLSLFQVTRQMPRQLTYGLFERTIILYIPVLVAILGGGPVHAAVAVAVSMTVLVVIELRDVRKRSPFTIGLAKAEWTLAASFIKPGLTFFAVSLAGTMVSMGMTLALSNRAGGLVVALFSTSLLLVNFVRTIVQQGMNVLWPEITGAAALQDDPGRLSRWYLLILKLASAFMLACAVGISLLGGDVLTAWTAGRLDVDPFLILVLAVYLAMHAPVLVGSVFGLALNRQADLMKVQVTSGVITLGSGVFLVSAYQAAGAAMALILGQAVVMAWIYKLACRWVGAPWDEFRMTTLPRLITGSLFLLLLAGFLSTSPIGLWGRTLSSCFLVLVVAAMFWRFWLSSSERNLLQTRLSGLKLRMDGIG